MAATNVAGEASQVRIPLQQLPLVDSFFRVVSTSHPPSSLLLGFKVGDEEAKLHVRQEKCLMGRRSDTQTYTNVAA